MSSTYKVAGMTCGGCVKSVEKALKNALPSAEIAVELEGGLVKISGDHQSEAVQSAIDDAGFEFQGPAAT